MVGVHPCLMEISFPVARFMKNFLIWASKYLFIHRVLLPDNILPRQNMIMDRFFPWALTIVAFHSDMLDTSLLFAVYVQLMPCFLQT